MKKIIIILCAFLMLGIVSTVASAMEYMAGAKAGYYAWQPFYKDLGASGMSDIEWGDGILYGPIVSFIFTPELSLSVAGLMGNQSTHWQSEFSDFDSSTSTSGNYHFEVFRIDLDSALSYRISESIRLFAGYKYLHMEVDYKYTELRTAIPNDNLTQVIMEDIQSLVYSHGPAAGLGYSLPLSQHYFISTNVSAVYMWGTIKSKGTQEYEWSDFTNPPNQAPGEMPRTAIRQIGLNIEPSIGMSPGKGLPIITLGFRYQRFWVQFTENTTGSDPFPSKWLDDTMLGVFMSVVFMF